MNATASNAGLWVNCAGSVLMQTLIPAEPGSEESEGKKEGKAFHVVAANVLKSFQDPAATMPKLIGTLAPNGVVVDEQMSQAVIDYVTCIMQYANEHGIPMSDIDIEKRIDTPILGDDRYAIPDVSAFDPATGELLLCDGKYGRRYVDIFENWQLLIYGISKLYEMPDQIKTIRMRVYQPRYYHTDGPCRDWVVSADEMHHYAMLIIDAVERVNKASICTPGYWCYASRCSAARGCTALASSCHNHIDYIDHVTPQSLSEADVTAEYLILKDAETRIKTRLQAMEQQCMSMIERGDRLPGLGVEQGYGHEAWRKDTPVEEVIMMGELMGVDIRKPTEILTPAKCREKGIDPDVIKGYSFRPKTKLKLVKDDGRKARMVFR